MSSVPAVVLAGTVLLSAIAGCARLPFRREVPPAAPLPERVDTLAWRAPEPSAVAVDDATVARWFAMGRVWTAVRWFHPAVADAPLAWEVAFLRHVDQVRAAQSDQAFDAAIAALLATLGDPDTRLAAPVRDSLVSVCTELGGPPARTAPDGVIDLRGRPQACDVPAAQQVTRWRPSSGNPGMTTLAAAAATATRWRLVREGLLQPLPLTPGIAWVRSGVPPWAVVVPEPADNPPAGDSATSALPPVVLVDRASALPPAFATVSASGRVRVVAVGGAPEASGLGAWHVPLRDGVDVRLRVEATADRAMRAPVVLDTVLAALGDSALHAALTALAADSTWRTAARASSPTPRVVAAITRGDRAYPSLPERVLTVVQLWGHARLAFAYAAIADRPLDDAALEALRDAAAARSSREWAAVLTRFSVALDATNAIVSTPVHPEYGQSVGRAPFTVALIEGRAIVIERDADVLPGIAVGDELAALGGEPIDKRLGRWRPLLSGGNEWTRERSGEAWLNAGPAGSTITARFVHADGSSIEQQVTYVAATRASSPTSGWRGAPTAIDTAAPGIVRIGGDVLRFTSPRGDGRAQLAPLLRDARGVVIDLRGAGRATGARELAPALAQRETRYAREVTTRWELEGRQYSLLPFDTVRTTVMRERIGRPRDSAPMFDGPLAILVDATTIADAELYALWLRRSGAPRVLIGTNTAGAVGTVEATRLWTGETLFLPVTSITDGDGRFLQRVGIAPDLFAAPTVAGVRDGRDETLAAAVRWIEEQLAPPPTRRRR